MGDDEALSTNELIEVICSALGKKAHIWNIPRGLMNGFTKIGDVLHLPLNSLRLQKLTENYVVSNAKIKAALEMMAMPVRAKDGLRLLRALRKNSLLLTGSLTVNEYDGYIVERKTAIIY